MREETPEDTPKDTPGDTPEKGSARRARPHTPRLRLQPVRSIDIGSRQDAFLIAAITTIVVIRLQLWATDYPQLGGGNLHIAHLLYGGFLMMIAIIVVLSFLGRGSRRIAAVLGGVGFGFFIDELGKFVTTDNDYFFKPTAAIVYIIFIVMYFTTRWIRNRTGFSEREYLFNAIDLFAEAARHDLDVEEKRRTLALLDRAGDDPLVAPLRRLVHQTDAIPVALPGRLQRLAVGVRDHYFRAVEKRGFRRVITWVFSLWAFLSMVQVVVLVFSVGLKIGGAQKGFTADGVNQLGMVNVASVVSSAVSAGFMIAGLRQLHHHHRLAAYENLDRALMVQIFVTQVFVFVESSFSALLGLLVSILLIVTVRYLIRRERQRARGDAGSPPPPASPDAVATAPAPA